MDLSQLFGRFVPKNWRGTTKVEYNFDMDEDQFTISIRNDMQKNWWLQVIKAINNMNPSNKVELLEGWEVTDQRLKDQMRNKIYGLMGKIVKDIRKDGPMKNFKILKMDIDKVIFKQIGSDNVSSEIIVKGLCHA
jgi:hypothetical protein